MSLNKLPEAFEEFVERARSALGQEITAAKNVVALAAAEKSAAVNALANLQSQVKAAQDQLAAVTEDLHRLSGLVGVGHDIEKARKELARVKSETAEATKALDKLSKERTERQAQIVALGNEAQRQLAIRTEAEAAMSKIKTQLGVRP
jgi:chromosome segregation ATPase